MDLMFICLETQKVFYTHHFKIDNFKGVSSDAFGNKTLDATVVLTKPCPLCGHLHSYHASELVCPFSGKV